MLKVKQHDHRPHVVATLQQSDGTPIDLTDAESVTFKMRVQAATELKVDAACDVDADPTTGGVRYEWVGTDTDTPGTYLFEFEIDWEAGAGVDPQTVPTDGYEQLQIVDDLDNP